MQSITSTLEIALGELTRVLKTDLLVMYLSYKL